MLDNKVKYKTKLIFVLFILISISIERAFWETECNWMIDN
jgi:hypothetical protein